MKSVYRNIGVKVEDLNPKEFKKSYRGLYSHYFRWIKDKHNLFIGIQKFSALLKIINERKYYGIIYMIIQIKDNDNNKLIDGGSLIYNNTRIKFGKIRIGKSINIKSRLLRYNTFSKNNPKYHFESAIAKYGWKSFKMKYLAVCFTEKEYHATEIFWTLYFNRSSQSLGYDLNINGFFNPMIGSRRDSKKPYKFRKCKIAGFILKGLNKKEIINYYSEIYNLDHQIDYKVLNNSLRNQFKTSMISKIQLKLISPIIKKCIKSGYNLKETLNYVKISGFDWFNASKRQNIRRITESFILKIYGNLRYFDDYSNKSSFNIIRNQIFVRPYVHFLKKNGVINMLPKINWSIYHQKKINDKIKINSSVESNKWSIVEYLYVKDVGLIDIAIFIDLIPRKSRNERKNDARITIERYLYNQWNNITVKNGGKNSSLLAIKTYLKSHDLSQKIYKNYLEKQYLNNQ